MRTFILYALLGWAAIIVQAAAIGPLVQSPYKPDIPFVLLIFVSLALPTRIGLPLAIIFGYFVGVFSGSIATLWVLVYVACFGLTKPFTSRFSYESISFRAVFPFVFTLIKTCLLYLGGNIFSIETGPASWLFTGAVVEGLFNSTAAFALFPGLDLLQGRPSSLEA